MNIDFLKSIIYGQIYADTKTGYTPLDKIIIKKYNATRPFSNKKHICNAPFAALRFDLYGQVLVCCYNKTHVLGNYPGDSIVSVWNGDNAKKLRKHLANNDLTLGCHICRTQLMNNSFFSVKPRCYDHLRPLKKQPVLLEFELDNTCNLECIMCNGETSSMIRKGKPHKPLFKTKYDKNFLAQIKQLLPKIQQANFIGGEPLLIPVYFDIIEEIVRVNPKAKINISTNGTILNDRIKKILEAGNFDISVSIDSIDKGTYEFIRKNADFEKTFSNLKYFHNYCKQNKSYFSIWVCPLTVNRFEIPDIFDYFNKLTIPVYLNSVVDPINLSIASLHDNELQTLKKYYQSFEFKNKTKVTSENYCRFHEFINQINDWILLAEKKRIMRQNVDVENILTIILRNLEEYYCNKFSGEFDNQSHFVIASQKINSVLSHFKNEVILKEILIYLSNFNIMEFAQIIETKSEDFLIEYLNENFYSK